MVFSSISFLYYFLPVTFFTYFLVPRKFKNFILLIASLTFYFYGEPIYTVLLLISSVSDFFHSRYIEKHLGLKKAKYALVSSVVINLGMLGFFKYADFLLLNINQLLGTTIPYLHLSLPIGISFFTFQTMSYTIDVYRGETKAERGFLNFATYVSLFPQLVAGPIVRYQTISDELKNRRHTLAQVSNGLKRFVIGLSKKVLIANQLGELSNIFRDSHEPSVLFYWIYAIAFSLQIYFDFSGYSDMAIGLGRMFGFSFPENFNYPYVSRSITDFWRRWHMTLGSWFRDYVYIPLGGNRGTAALWIRNIVIVWFLTGFWHGAQWNFAIWGLYFGAILVLEKKWTLKYLEGVHGVVRHLYVLLVVILSFVIFNATGISGISSDLAGLFGFKDIPMISNETIYQMKNYAVVLILAMIGATPVIKAFYFKLLKYKISSILMIVIEPATLLLLLVSVTAFLVDGSYNPFLYFRF
jgi:Predicted membrane protein involved in D-alanine export